MDDAGKDQATGQAEAAIDRPVVRQDLPHGRRVPSAGQGVIRKIGESAPWRMLRLFEPLGIIAAVVGLYVEFASRDEARVVSAWQVLTTRAPEIAARSRRSNS